VLALCQVVVETVVVAARTCDFVLPPYALARSQAYDFAVKLVGELPAVAQLLIAGALDRFLPPGFVAKLGLAASLLAPNVVVLGTAASVFALFRFVRSKEPSSMRTLRALVILGITVHVCIWLLSVYDGRDGSWHVDQHVLSDAASALAVLAASAAAAALIARCRPPGAWLVPGVMTAAVAVAAWLPAPGVGSDDREIGYRPGHDAQPPVEVVILISIDSLRADRLGAYGNSRDTSPTIDRLGREGARFSNALATSPWTLPSHMSLLTGRDSLAHGVNTERDRLSPAVPTLAEELRNGGFVTVATVAESVFLAAWRGFGRGFDVYDDATVSEAMWLHADNPAPLTTKLAVQLLRRYAGRRLFLFVHYWDVHYDYLPPAPYDTMFDPHYRGHVSGIDFMEDPAIDEHMATRDLDHLLALYDGEVRRVDDHVGRIVQTVDELDIAERTAFIVTSDHGDEFFEHGGKGHGLTLYRELIHVPLTIRAPGGLRGHVIDTPVSLIDVVPTVLELAGVEPSRRHDGRSLVPALGGHTIAPRRAVHALRCYAGSPRCQAARYSTEGTVIHEFWPFGVELYGPRDLHHLRNVADSDLRLRADQLGRLTADLDRQWLAYRTGGGVPGRGEIDEATRERLRELGYAQ